MKPLRSLLVGLSLIVTACSAGSPASCVEYAGKVRSLIDGGASGAELTRYVEDTQEQVAHLIADDPQRAGPCVESVLEAVFIASFEEFEGIFYE